MELSIRGIYLNGTRFAIGTCSVQNYMRAALDLLANGRINAQPLCGTRMSLESVTEGYNRFDRDKSVFKVLLLP